ncbi:MAG: ATP-binding cassette domain-containing protein [Anaerolineae bacterium]|nr:ATP-binding cassette domain-containing protein [Anaerolineae bacterium]
MCPDDSPLLKLSHIDTYYGPIQILKDVNVEIHEGEMVCLLGGNASGKSTTLKTILGLVKPARGTIEFRGERIDGLPTGHIVTRGLAIVPENRRIFPEMTVLENLEMGAYLRHDKEGIKEDMERALALFPHLRERLSQLGGTLSGGEQQMLAIARALMSRPQLLLMDEPSMGLAPILVERIFELIQEINRQGTSIFMVEQNANMALSIADRGYVLQTGRIVLADTAQNLLQNEMMKKAYLGT